jgi:hypothetical protein
LTREPAIVETRLAVCGARPVGERVHDPASSRELGTSNS